ncbi:unnamed protein product [[Candida] boidinii]|uniref:non-specific serine/threonine protein kinase n=1 Tax=Candida boidinii TaxID=5477 RepID=A0A9W6WDA9_CANBO|nr:hypothetical protein B5S33_g4734 [[Candida] boidinii]GME66871.1 unnamed protein product [[Candida] boidinii]GMG10634.1 unnamed protein product [[Candida] boidinii]
MSLADLFSCCLPCISTTPRLKINKASFKILSLLGEGGFSYVYLVEASNGGLYALKKIRCPFGAENVRKAMIEVDNYKEFKSPFIMRSIDSSIVQEPDGTKTIYILLPYFEGGSLQDIISKNSLEGTQISDDEAIRIFIGIARGLQTMHRHHITHNYTIQNFTNQSYDDNTINGNSRTNEEEHPFLASSGTRSTSSNTEDDFALENNDDNSTNNLNNGAGTELAESISFAHRDIKPANVMLSKDGIPVLADLGSASKARISIKTRAQAITTQELAEEHCTLPYRAPELLDVKVGSEINEKIDIWSLGCTLYALLYGYSPFEREEMQNGANIKLAISSGNYSFPSSPDYDEDLKELIKFCIVVEPEERPSIEDVLSKALSIQRHRS